MAVCCCPLQAQVERIKICVTPYDEASACTAHLGILVIIKHLGPEEQQVPLVLLGQDSVLFHSSTGDYHALLRTSQNQYTLQALVRRPHLGHALSSLRNRQPAVIHYSKLSLNGPQRAPAAQQDQPSIAAVTAVTAANTATWQLQQRSWVPACKGLQLLPGAVTCCCLLMHQLEWQQQQHTQLQQLLQTAGSDGGSPSNSQLLETLTAAALSAASAGSVSVGRHAAVQNGPAHCTSGLFAAVMTALLTGGSCINPTDSSGISSSCNRLPCMFLAGSSTGQLWVCDPTYALLGAGNSSSSGIAAAATPDPTAHNPQQPQQSQRQQCRSLPRLLVDFQQPIVALLPFSGHRTAGSSSPTLADTILVVGSLGRVGLLHLQPQMQERDAAVTKSSVQLIITQQQLPFLIKSAQLLEHPTGQQQQGQQQQQQQTGYVLLLLSGFGSLYVADLTARDAATLADLLSGSSGGSCGKTLCLQPVKLELPGRVSSFWVIPTPNHASASDNLGIAAAAAAGSSGSSCQGCIVAQLQGGNELVQVAVDWRKLFQQQQQQQGQGSGQALKEGQQAGTSAAAATAVALTARGKLNGLMSALEILITARQSLEQVIKGQDSYLAAVKQDLQLLKSLHTATSPAAAAASGLPANSSEWSAPGQAKDGDGQLLCDVALQGLWPAPAAAVTSSSTGCSSSMHMAVTVHLQVCSSSSSSTHGVSRLGFGPGWQLLISFMPESSHNPSWQTTVPANFDTLASSSSSSQVRNGSSRALSASLLLPLPDACCKLSEGGWLQVYAVKECPKTVIPPVAAQQQQASREGSLPAVVLLRQQYISVLVLSRMLAVNPAAAAVSATAAAAAAAPVVSDKSYSCVLQLQAAHQAAIGVTDTNHQRKQQQADQYTLHKRSRTNMQQATAGSSRSVQLQQPQQQQPQQQPQQEVVCSNDLSRWLESISLAPQERLHSSTSSTSTSSMSLPGLMNRVSLFHGQVGYKLGQGSQGQLTWASRPLLPAQQQQQQQQQQHIKTGAGTAAGSDGEDQQLVTLPVQVGMQASSVAGLAQMHRAYIMAVLEKLKTARTAGNTPTTDSTQSSSSWCITSNKQQLQKALQQLKQLQQQMMKVQGIAEDAINRREQLLLMLQPTLGDAGQPVLQEADLQPQGVVDAAGVVGVVNDLRGVFGKWESELHAAYARMLQAMSTAACITCLEV